LYDSEVLVGLVKGRCGVVASIKGSQVVEVGVSVDGERLAVFCALDNLVKGGAGQAIQSFNIMMDRPEQLGLSGPATWP